MQMGELISHNVTEIKEHKNITNFDHPIKCQVLTLNGTNVALTSEVHMTIPGG
jgi:hypothetical protein